MRNGDDASQKDSVPNGAPNRRQELAAEANIVGYGKCGDKDQGASSVGGL